MSLHFSLLLSLVLHLVVVLPLLERSAQTPPAPKQPLEAELLMPPLADTVAENLTSLPNATSEPPLPSTPKPMRGAALRRAQAILSKHLFYPDEAIRRGLEGEVLLLLMLDKTGRVQRAEIARSSGHALLDNAALEAVQRIGLLPGNPPQTLFPVSFHLE